MITNQEKKRISDIAQLVLNDELHLYNKRVKGHFRPQSNDVIYVSLDNQSNYAQYISVKGKTKPDTQKGVAIVGLKNVLGQVCISEIQSIVL